MSSTTTTTSTFHVAENGMEDNYEGIDPEAALVMSALASYICRSYVVLWLLHCL